MPTQYMFVAGGDACGACAALDGTISNGGLGQQHENCQCQDVPVHDEDCPSVEVPSIHIETTGGTTTVGGDVTVVCCDGSEIGESVEVDLGPVSLPIDETIDAFMDAFDSAAAELAGTCPEGVDIWVEDGEEGGLA
jgi:hypothetical protein